MVTTDSSDKRDKALKIAEDSMASVPAHTYVTRNKQYDYQGFKTVDLTHASIGLPNAEVKAEAEATPKAEGSALFLE